MVDRWYLANANLQPTVLDWLATLLRRDKLWRILRVTLTKAVDGGVLEYLETSNGRNPEPEFPDQSLHRALDLNDDTAMRKVRLDIEHRIMMKKFGRFFRPQLGGNDALRCKDHAQQLALTYDV